MIKLTLYWTKQPIRLDVPSCYERIVLQETVDRIIIRSFSCCSRLGLLGLCSASKRVFRRLSAGRPEAAAAAVICFEFLQRPENVLGGYLAWPDYRGQSAPNAIKITHHKTGAVVWHPLEETTEHGTVRFYSDAEAVLAHLPRRGVAMILKARPDGTTEPFTAMQMAKITRKLRDRLALPPTFTLDACRHGGMTELEEAELTDGQGRALSGHRTQRAYEGYAKRTLERALPATRKRYAHALQNVQSTSVQNATRSGVQNEPGPGDAAIA